MSKLTKAQKDHFIKYMRKSSFRWYPRSQAFNRAKVQVGEYSTGRPKFKVACALCGNLFAQKDIQLDHLLPVVPVEGWTNGEEFDANEYVDRLLCEADGFLCLCISCHKIKTQDELVIRKATKEAKKT